MENLFLILEYEVPKDIFKDTNYNVYLRTILNKLHDLSGSIQGSIIFSGGHTDCYKPYRRTEAEEGYKLWKKISRKSPIKKWPAILEKKSLSTLENLLFCREIILAKKISDANLYIFCEFTRRQKVNKLAKRIFDKKYKINIIPVDFDTSTNRYLDASFISKKESQDLKLSLWALENKSNMSKYHSLLKKRIADLRKAGSAKHVQAVYQMWKEEIRSLK